MPVKGHAVSAATNVRPAGAAAAHRMAYNQSRIAARVTMAQ